jgi:hypothetical protein
MQTFGERGQISNLSPAIRIATSSRRTAAFTGQRACSVLHRRWS